MLKPQSVAGALCIFWLLGPGLSDAQACSCGDREGRDWARVLQDNTVIFAGRVLSRELPPSDWRLSDGKPVQMESGHSLVAYRFSMDALWQGEAGTSVELVSRLSTSSCGYPFELERDYLVFARLNHDGKLQVSHCSPTAPLALALRQRHRLGTPPLASYSLPPMPKIEQIDAWLTEGDRAQTQSAIRFWQDLDCGLALLYQRIDELPISDYQKDILIRDIHERADYIPSDLIADGLPLRKLFPPPRSSGAVPPQRCSEPVRDWVGDRLQER